MKEKYELTTFDDLISEAKKENASVIEEAEFISNIVVKIVKARRDLGMTQEDLAQKTGLKQSAIARIESCTVVPKITTLRKILEQLNLDIMITEKIPTNYNIKVIQFPEQPKYSFEEKRENVRLAPIKYIQSW